MKVARIAEAIDAEIIGNADVDIERIRPIEKAGRGDLTFLLDGKEPPASETVSATAIIINKDIEPASFPETITLLRNTRQLLFLYLNTFLHFFQLFF